MRLSPPITILAIVVAAMGWLIIDRAWTEHNNLEACSVAEAFADFTQAKADVFGGPPLTMPLTATAVDQLQQRLPDTPEYRIAAELLLRSVIKKSQSTHLPHARIWPCASTNLGSHMVKLQLTQRSAIRRQKPKVRSDQFMSWQCDYRLSRQTENLLSWK